MNWKLALTALLASPGGTSLFASAQVCPPKYNRVKPIPVRDVKFHEKNSKAVHGYTLFQGARIVEPAPDGIPRALRIDKQFAHALLKGIDISPDVMEEVTLSVSVYIESIPTCPGCIIFEDEPQVNSYGWVLSHDNGGYDRAIYLHDERFKGMGMTSNKDEAPEPKYELTPPLQKWFNIIGVWRQGGECALYVDSERVEFVKPLEGNNGKGLPDVAIGSPQQRRFGKGNKNDLWVKDVKIFNYALSDEEVQSLNCQFEETLEPTLDCGQGGGPAYSCSECVAGDGSASGCGGDCMWRPEIPHCVEKGDTIENDVDEVVSCGDHEATDCSQCGVSADGSSGCSGDCKFVDGECKSSDWEPEPVCELENVALAASGGVATQSSTDTYQASGPELAIDGNTGAHYNRDKSMSHTKAYGSKSPSWNVNFQKATISEVVIYNRSDCCQDRLQGHIMEILDGTKVVYSSTVSQESATAKLVYNHVVPQITGDNVRIRLEKNVPLHMAEVEVMGSRCNRSACKNPTNVAIGGVAAQSTTSDWPNSEAWLAIDGNTGGDYKGDKTMSHTSPNHSRNPWWQVMVSRTLINGIQIYNRSDCCQDRMKGLIVEIFDAGQLVYSSEVSSPDESLTSKPKYFYVIPDITGDMVRVRLHNKGKPLHIAEVEVMGCDMQVTTPSTCRFENVALAANGGTASQSSTDTWQDSRPELAIDGNTGAHYTRDKTMSHTKAHSSKSPWWKVEFDSTIISDVAIYNRSDCCDERLQGHVLEIWNGNVKVYSSKVSDIEESAAVRGLYRHIIPQVRGTMVKVRLEKDVPLHMAEVEVMGLVCD